MHPDETTPTTTTTEKNKHLRVQVAAKMHRRLRHLAADRDVPVGALIAEAIETYMKGVES
jgi:predicted DNA-binding protein